MSERTFLFLQGPLSSFYSEIGGYLMGKNEKVLKVNFCGNDLMDWKHKNAINFRGGPDVWKAFLEQLLKAHAVTHIILHGDRRYYHQTALQLAKSLDIEVIVTELGYLRPDWMTVEKGACSTGSHFPLDPEVIKKISAKVGPYDKELKYKTQTHRMITQELRFTVFNFLLWPFFPHYLNHRPESRITFYTAWLISKLSRKRRLSEIEHPYYVFALQLEGDFQLRDHSPFKTVDKTLDYVIKSFSDNAPADSRLLIKLHPDEVHHKRLNGTVNKMTQKYSVMERVLVVEGGDLVKLAQDARGFVTVNSSAGMASLAAGCPTCSIMPTIYDVVGLTFQGSLDDFWKNAVKPDNELFNDLCNALAGTIQVRGTLYHPEGLQSAARSIAEKIMTDNLNNNGAYVPVPPRLDKAERMGVTYGE